MVFLSKFHQALPFFLELVQIRAAEHDGTVRPAIGLDLDRGLANRAAPE